LILFISIPFARSFGLTKEEALFHQAHCGRSIKCNACAARSIPGRACVFLYLAALRDFLEVDCLTDAVKMKEKSLSV
jgi:hypothetical protein